MSKQIDERVVEMRFDNKNFESNVQTSMSTIEKLKQKLNFKDASKGFENIDKAAKNVKMDYLGKSVEAVRVKFSALEVMGVTALANITNSAVNAGKRIASALTIDPIKTGFQEYETQINAVQTILANTESKGTTLQQVNAALDELNTYADKTIYNFTEMTRNIGTFTAAGVDLKTSVSAIQGIANLAAVSGSNAQQASTAMYQLSQALASGTVKLMDWNSVVNAGMGGQVFQDALKETARVHGVAIDKMIKDEGSFRETLQKGWLTSDILTETLQHFTMAAEEGSEAWESYKKSLMDSGYTEKQAISILKLSNTATDAATKVKTFTQLWDTLKESAQSGWTQSWEIMIGDFEEAKGFLTDVSNRIGELISASADARNKVLSEGLSSGWKQLLDKGISDEQGYVDTIKSVAKEHGTSIDSMIEAEKKLDSSLTDREAFQKSLKKGLEEGTITSDMLSESVHKLAEKMSSMSAKELTAAGYMAEHVQKIKELSDGLKDGSVSMDEFVSKMTRTSGRENTIQALWNSFDGLMSVLKPVKEAFSEIFPPITGEQLYSFTESIVKITEKFKITDETANKIKNTFKGLFSIIKIGVTIIKSIISGISQLIVNIAGLSGDLLNATSSLGNWITGLSESITETNIFGKAIDKIVNFITKAIDKIKEFKSYLSDKIDFSEFEVFSTILQSVMNMLKTVGASVTKVATAIGKSFANAFRNGDMKSLVDLLNGGLFTTILLGIKKYISGITDKFDDTVSIVDRIKKVIGSVEDSFKSLQENLKSGTLKNIAVAIAILAGSLFVLSMIDPDKLSSALTAMTVSFGELIGSLYLLNKIGGIGKEVSKSIPILIGISVAVLILASALTKLSDLSWEQIGKGLTGVLGLMLILVGAAQIMSMGEKKIKTGAMQMVIMAAALKILASVCKDLSNLSWEELGKGVSGIGAILLEFAGFQALMKKIKPEKMLSSALSLVLIGAAMEIFADVCSKFGEMEWGDLGKAGAAIGGILLIVSGFDVLAGKANNLIKSSVSLVLIGAAMEIFSDVCNKFGEMEWEELGKAGTAMGGILLIVSIFDLLAGKANNLIKASMSLVLIGAAMEIFADVCNKFGEMEWEQLGKAGAAIGGILALAAGFALLAGLSSGILASSAALLIMAVALNILTPVLTTLGSMTWGEIVKGLVTIAGAFAVLGIAGLLLGPLIPAILGLCGALALLGVACLSIGVGVLALGAGLTALAASGTAGATALVAALTIIIVGILELIPQIVNSLTNAIVAICNVIIQSAPAIGEAIKALILTAIDVLVTCVPELTNGLLQLLIGVFNALAEGMPELLSSLANLFVQLFNGLATHAPEMIAAVLNLLTTVLGEAISGIANALGPIIQQVLMPISDIIKNIICSILEVLAPYIPNIQSMIESICNAFNTLVTNIAPIIDSVSNLIQQLGDSISTVLGSVADTVTSCGDAISSVLESTGEAINNAFSGIADVIRSVGDSIKSVLDGIAGIIDSIGNAALNAGTGFDKLAHGVKTITNLKLTDMIASLAAVAKGIKDISENADGLSQVGNGMKQIQNGAKTSASAFTTVANGIQKIVSSMSSLGPIASSSMSALTAAVISAASNVSNSSVQFAAAGQNIVNGLVKSITQGLPTISNSVKTLLTSTVKSINNYYNSFYNAGKYLVQGFAKGITDNTFIAEAKAKAMANAAYDAAKDALAINSPSKKFMVIGSSVCEGLAKGITKNVGYATNAAIAMSDNILSATQDRLKINSPSLVFDEGVGRYIAQGIGEGITKDMSPEEAAKKKASNIASAFKEEFDRYEKMARIEKVRFETWLRKDGMNASNDEFLKKQKEYADRVIEYRTQQEKLAHDEWQQTLEIFEEGSDQEKDALEKLAKAEKELLNAKNIGVIQNGIKQGFSSLAFDENLGRYIAQNIGKGLEGDMTPEEAAKKKAENIAKAFKEEIDRHARLASIEEKGFNLWLLTDGKYATDEEIDTKQRDYLKRVFEHKVQQQKLAYDEWQQTLDVFKAGSDQEKEALEKYVDSQIETENARNKLAAVLENAKQRKYDELNKAQELIDAKNELWKAQNAFLSDAQKAQHQVGYLNETLDGLIKEVQLHTEDYNQAVKNYGAKSSEALEELKKCLKTSKEIAKTKKEIAETLIGHFDTEIEDVDHLMDLRQLDYEHWELTTGKRASDAAKDRKLTEKLLEDQKDLHDKWTNENMKYWNYVHSKDFGPNSAEAKEADKARKEARNAYYENEKAIAQIEIDAIERERENLKTRLELANKNADLRYRIWEKTEGRNATSLEKDLAKVGLLSAQLKSQTELLNVAREEYVEACKKYGKASNEAQEAYSEFLQKQLDIATLQSEITDIQESAADREKLALSDYKKYMDRYRKYYLMNGMTEAELEKDARLVSGYDPNNTINAIITKTNEALNSVKNSKEYDKLISNFNSLGTEYVDAVNEGVREQTEVILTTMTRISNNCVNELRSNQSKWTEAGKHLVEGFAKGITASVSIATSAVKVLGLRSIIAMKTALNMHSPSKEFFDIGEYAVKGFANGFIDNSKLSEDAVANIGENAIDNLKSTISRIYDVINSDMETDPTIRPVLDLSNVEAGTARLNAMFSKAQAMRINATMSKDMPEEIQNGYGSNGKTNVFNYTQNNYSPKALSRSEIYRQTKNQFSALKGALT